MNKKLIAAALRRHLERRLAQALECEPQDFKNIKIGTLVHLLFTVHGDSESVGGFSSTIHGVLTLCGAEEVWRHPDEPEDDAEEKKEEKERVN